MGRRNRLCHASPPRGARKSIADYAHGYGRTILAWQHEIGVPVLPLSAAEDTATQVRRLLGQAAGVPGK